MSKEQNIENLFKDKFDNFKPEVNPSLWNNIAQQLPASAPVSHGIESGARGLLKTLGIKTIVTAITAVVIISSAIVYYATKENPVPAVSRPSATEQTKNNSSNVVEPSTTSTISEVKENQLKKTPSGKNAEKVVLTNSDAKNLNTGNATTDNGLKQSQEAAHVDNSHVNSNNNTPAENQTQQNTEHAKKDNSPDVSSTTSSAKSQTTRPELSECDKLKKNLPNTFSPNGDGNNDTFYLPGLDEKITTLKVGIYQMGKLVYEWEGINGSWDGSMKDGSPASIGDYVCVYIFETKSGESCSGFTPVRIFR